MTILQVQLSNTFNEFRQTVNNVSNTVNAFTDGTTGTPATFSTQSLFAAGVAANTLNVSTLTAGRVPFVAASGSITDASGLTFNSSTAALTVAGNIKSGSIINMIAANGAIMTTGNTITGNMVGRHIESIGSGESYLAGTIWHNNRGEDPEQHLVIGIGDIDGSHDIAIVNTNTGANGYAEFIAYSATGNSEDGWISTGVNSPTYSQGAYSITGPDDGYLLYEPKNGSSGNGNLVIATGAGGRQNQIIIGAGGFADPANNQQMVITPGQKVAITINTQSSNTTTGALVVNGGIGLLGNLNVGGNVAITGTITLGGGGNTVSTSSLSVDNPMIFLGANNAADVLDLGLVGEYTSSGKKYAGLVRDASDSGIFKLFANNSTRPNNAVNFSDANNVYGTLLVGTLRANSAISSTSNTTGTLVVTGGVGVSGNVYASSFTGNTGATVSSFTTDQTFTGAANTSVPTAWAVKTYVDNNSGTLSWSIKTTANNNYLAVAGDSLMCDTSNGSFTILLPASPANNSRVVVADVAGTFGTRPLIINNNGNKVQGANNILYLDMVNAGISLVYVNSTYGWRII
jgi:hypothetical protein